MESSRDSVSRANLYLVGFMGTGKSSIGREVARKLGFRFIDSDRWIEKRAGMKIPTIFSEKGEAWFREQEREFIEEGHPAEGCVVACGGGLIVPPGRLKMVQERGVVIVLWASVDTIVERTSRKRDRPLLHVDDPKPRIIELMKEREPIYRGIELAVSTDGRSLGEVKDAVVRIYRNQRPRGSS